MEVVYHSFISSDTAVVKKVVSLCISAELALTMYDFCLLLWGTSKWKRHAQKNHGLSISWHQHHHLSLAGGLGKGCSLDSLPGKEGGTPTGFWLFLLSGPAVLKMSNFPMRTLHFGLIGSYSPINFHWFPLQAHRGRWVGCPGMGFETFEFLFRLYCYLTVSFWTHYWISL